MDYILLALCLFCVLRGIFKGFVSMLFSLLGVFFVVFLAWKLCDMFVPISEELFGTQLETFVSNLLDEMFEGSFSDSSALEEVISESKYGVIFSLFFGSILENITFDGNLSAGEILGYSTTSILIKVITFAMLFLLLFLAVKILRALLNKLVKKCGLSFGNRCLGGVVGLIKGLLLFGVVYFVFISLANLLVNESLLNFVTSGTISNYLYENFISVIINLFY